MHASKLALVIGLAFVGGTAVAIAPPATAQVSLSINVGVAPPPLRYEVVPAPRVGYVWAPGYWNWSGRRYVWVGGTWHHSRPGYVYYNPRWVHDRGRWVYHRSYWGADPRWHHDNGRHNGWYKHHGDHGDHGHHGHHHGDDDDGD